MRNLQEEDDRATQYAFATTMRNLIDTVFFQAQKYIATYQWRNTSIKLLHDDFHVKTLGLLLIYFMF